MQESVREIITRRRKSLFRSKNVRATLLCPWDLELCPCVQINIHRNTPPLLMKFGEHASTSDEVWRAAKDGRDTGGLREKRNGAVACDCSFSMYREQSIDHSVQQGATEVYWCRSRLLMTDTKYV
jgi:hypothetical protein